MPIHASYWSDRLIGLRTVRGGLEPSFLKPYRRNEITRVPLSVFEEHPRAIWISKALRCLRIDTLMLLRGGNMGLQLVIEIFVLWGIWLVSALRLKTLLAWGASYTKVKCKQLLHIPNEILWPIIRSWLGGQQGWWREKGGSDLPPGTVLQSPGVACCIQFGATLPWPLGSSKMAHDRQTLGFWLSLAEFSSAPEQNGIQPL